MCRQVHASCPSGPIALDSHPNRTVGHLSRALGRSHSATVRLVDGLERAGLVTRRPGPDARSIVLELTDTGAAQAREMRADRARVLDGLIDALTAAEVAALEPLFERLLAASAVDADSRWRICRLCEEPRCEGTHRCPVDEAAPR